MPRPDGRSRDLLEASPVANLRVIWEYGLVSTVIQIWGLSEWEYVC